LLPLGLDVCCCCLDRQFEVWLGGHT
jgi:hypothetical protein